MSEILGYDKYGRPVRAGDRVRLLYVTNPAYPGAAGDVLTVTAAATGRGVSGKLFPAFRVSEVDRLVAAQEGVARIDNDQFTPADTTFHELLGQISKQGAKA